MPNKLTFNGMEDLKDALRMLPEELTDDGGEIVRFWAMAAAGAARASYARGPTGHLQDGVVVETDNSGFGSRWGVRYIVKSKAPHAFIYEYGTKARHYYTKSGAKHDTGIMPEAPPGRAFVPKMIDARAKMYDQLVSMLVGHGLGVRGNWRAA
jgi:hypothetical protein